MRAVVQRSYEASVKVDDKTIGEIDWGMVVLLGVKDNDTEEDLKYILRKVLNLRIFDDENGVMNKSILDVGGSILLISQFTLYGDVRKGNRPSYSNAAGFEEGKALYEKMIKEIEKSDIKVETGSYGADMEVSLINNGPVTILLDSEKVF